MNPNTTQPKRRDNVLFALNVAIETSILAKEVSSITPAKAVFGSVSFILTMIRVGFFLGYPARWSICNLMENVQDSVINQVDYVELGLACADVCIALDRGLSGKLLKDLNDPVWEVISQLMT